MIAKVIAHAPTRREAAAKLARALETTQLHGITNNRDFLVATLRTPAFIAGDTTTDFIERVNPMRTREPNATEVSDAAIAAALFAQDRRRKNAKVLRHISSGWRNSMMPPERVGYAVGDSEYAIEYRANRDGTFDVNVSGDDHHVTLHGVNGDQIDLAIDQRRIAFAVSEDEANRYVHAPTGDVVLTELDRFPKPGVAEFTGGLYAPMPGKVLATEVSPGESVSEGQLLVILEAMKMEHRITAPIDGVVQEVPVNEGDQVDNGQILIVFEENEGES